MKNGLAILCVLFTASCIDGSAPMKGPLPLTAVRTDRTYLRDSHGRYIFQHGVNVSGSTKVPTSVDSQGIPTYVGKPFPLDVARQKFSDLRRYGFDSIRLLIIWEGIEPVRKGEYDQDYLDYIREIVKIAGEYGIYVLIDMHQDNFSRHLVVKYNNSPTYGTPGSVENTLLSLIPDSQTGQYNDSVQGDGAPRWVVEACLPEKDLNSKYWGTPRLLSGLGNDELKNIYEVYKKITGSGGSGGDDTLPDWLAYFLVGLPGKFQVHETNDLLPFTTWFMGMTISLDSNRCYGCLFAGDRLFPGLEKDGQNVKDYVQEGYANSFAQVADHVKDLPNVLGYDLMNEPGGAFIALALMGGLIRAGAPTGAQGVLVDLLGPETGEQLYQAILALRLLPPDSNPETLKEYGLDKLDVMTALSMNYGFDENYLRPFYERVGQAILEKDTDAIIFIETTRGLQTELLGGGVGGQWEVTMTRPAGLPQVVYSPHRYADIYPFLGFNQPPRNFTVEQVRYRDYQPMLEKEILPASYSLGNLPVVYGEFGTYFNYNGGAKSSEAEQYQVSSHFLDNYYEAFERMFQSKILWCYSPENDFFYGDRWNHEDFSIVDWRGDPRSADAWARPHARALAGKPISTHFYSKFHYFDPDKGIRDPEREFEVRYKSKETQAPSEIVVPPVQYPDGFYVWISDGFCYYDANTYTLYHVPSSDEPGAEHWVRLRPPLPNQENVGWKYFFKDNLVVNGD